MSVTETRNQDLEVRAGAVAAEVDFQTGEVTIVTVKKILRLRVEEETEIDVQQFNIYGAITPTAEDFQTLFAPGTEMARFNNGSHID